MSDAPDRLWEMKAFDELPESIRRGLADAPISICAIDVARDVHIHGETAVQSMLTGFVQANFPGFEPLVSRRARKITA